MSPEENMQDGSAMQMTDEQMINMKVLSAKQFTLGTFVVASNALVNTSIKDINNVNDINEMRSVVAFLEQSILGSLSAINDTLNAATARVE